MRKTESIVDGKLEEFQTVGRVWFRSAVGAETVEKLRNCANLAGQPGRRFGQNDELTEALATSGADSTLGEVWPGARLRRVVAFDKSGEANWKLPWHQDRVIAVKAKCEVDGYDRWSQKAGVWHCEPPVDVLQQMLFVRLHLDACDAATGAMEIALGSHHAGTLTKAEIAARIDQFDHEVTVAEPGDLLVMSMLMVHRSPPASAPSTRRVLRLDYGLGDLPAPLDWAI